MTDKNAMYKLSYGLFVLTAHENGKDNGCIVNTVTQVTTEPNRITVVINKSNYTCGMIERTRRFNVSILTEKSTFKTYRHWGFQSGATIDKCKNVTFCRADNGVVYLTDECNTYLTADVVSVTDLGTHLLFLADVCDAVLLSDEESVTYAYYQAHIKPVPSTQKKETGYICTVCGFIYQGDTLPDDFICPWCKHPASDFVPLTEK